MANKEVRNLSSSQQKTVYRELVGLRVIQNEDKASNKALIKRTFRPFKQVALEKAHQRLQKMSSAN